MEKTDLIVVGGGVLGTFHAYHALERGLSVRLFERHNKPQGATVRNFGQVVPSGMDAKWQQIGRHSLEIYKTLQAQFDLSLRVNGSIYIASDEAEMNLLEELRQINENNGYSSELWNKAKCLAHYSGLREDYCRGGLYFPEEATVEARKMIHRVLDFLQQEKSLHYHTATPIQHLAYVNGQCEVVDNHGQKYFAEQVILCGGDEFQTLFPQVFAESDLEVTKLQMLQTVPQPHLRVDGNILTGLSIRRYESFKECPSYKTVKAQEDPAALWKKWGVHILFKQCPDGSFIIGDSHEYADATRADELGFDLRNDINQYMLAEARKIFQLEDWTIQQSWAGRYSQCKSSDIFQRSIADAIHIVTGIGGKGMTGSPGFAASHIAQLYGQAVSI